MKLSDHKDQKIQSLLRTEPISDTPSNPCDPNPCGPNSQCRQVNGSPSCSCFPEYVGAPPNCRPECVSNSDCPNHLSCFNRKCKDPCPGSCGSNASCRVANHAPTCFCLPGHTGDPFRQCYPTRKSFTSYSKFS